MPKIIIHDAIHPAAKDKLKSQRDIKIVEIMPAESDKLNYELRDADGIILRYLPLNKMAISVSKKLKIIARHGVGCDNIDMKTANKLGIPVATVGDANSVTVAELTMYLILVSAKQGLAFDRAVRSGDWVKSRETLNAIELCKKNIFIIGFGRIGKLVAARCKAFEMNVLVYDPYVDQKEIAKEGYKLVRDIKDGLSESEVITLHVPLNKETFHLIGEEALMCFKNHALLINTSRGPVINEEALCKVLKSDQNILSVGLDVFENEPLLVSAPISQFDNIALTPHIGGLTKECYYRSSMRCVQNIIDGINGDLNKDFVINSDIIRYD